MTTPVSGLTKGRAGENCPGSSVAGKDGTLMVKQQAVRTTVSVARTLASGSAAGGVDMSSLRRAFM
jgi:hypothetical protein